VKSKVDMGIKYKKTKAKTIRRVVIAVFLCITAAFFTIDLLRVGRDAPPVFCVPLIYYDDGGSVDYYGIGYKVIKDYDITEDETEFYIAPWFMPKFFIYK
jgi:hypothetical protein